MATNFEKEYINLWKMRELVFSVNPELGLEAYFGLSKQIHKAINDYFLKIKRLDYIEKVDVCNKLKVICAQINNNDRLFQRVLRHTYGDKKSLLTLCISTKTALTNGVKLIEFELEKRDNSCNCALKQELNLSIQSKPSTWTIIIKKFTDGYYEYELHQCTECNTFWINDLYSDDGPSKGWRKPMDKYEFEIIKKYLESDK